MVVGWQVPIIDNQFRKSIFAQFALISTAAGWEAHQLNVNSPNWFFHVEIVAWPKGPESLLLDSYVDLLSRHLPIVVVSDIGVPVSNWKILGMVYNFNDRLTRLSAPINVRMTVVFC